MPQRHELTRHVPLLRTSSPLLGSYSPKCLELEFSEVRSSKQFSTLRTLGHRGGATRGFVAVGQHTLPHSWRGFVTSGCDLLLRGFVRIPRNRHLSYLSAEFELLPVTSGVPDPYRQNRHHGLCASSCDPGVTGRGL